MEEEREQSNINIFYEKNPTYRTVYVDGVIGGITPSGSVNLNLYSTRKSIPKSVSHKINQDGTLNPDGRRSEDSKDGIIREIEFGVYMNQKAATEIYLFLKKILNKD